MVLTLPKIWAGAPLAELSARAAAVHTGRKPHSHKNLGWNAAFAEHQAGHNGLVTTLLDAPAPALRIGPLALRSPVVLAPMAGITNVAFRTLCLE